MCIDFGISKLIFGCMPSKESLRIKSNSSLAVLGLSRIDCIL